MGGGTEMDPGELIDPKVKETLRPKLGKEFYDETAGYASVVRMGLNENMVVDSGFASMLLEEAAKRTDPRRYPAPKGACAIKAISEGIGVWEDEVVVGNGADEILDLICKVYVGSGEAIVAEPTFEMYRFYIGLGRGSARTSMLTKDFGLDVEGLLASITDETKVIFICSPNNPTGKQFSKDDVLKVVEESDRLVVVDEAYSDFAPYSLCRESTRYQNMLVLRTFSKAFGLAGLRLGYAVSTNETTGWLRAAQSPFNVNAVAQEMARLVLENNKIYEEYVKKTVEERAYLKAELDDVNGIEAFESDANFILFRVLSRDLRSADVVARLKGAGFEVRDRGDLPMLENCIRVTVSTRQNNMRFAGELVKALRG
jgi:histidinol-phosphate aminotransferase